MWRKLRWKLYCLKLELLYYIGVRCGWINCYEIPLIERLRGINYGGLPASVILLVRRMCDGNCYDRATLISLGMDKFEIVWGTTQDLSLRYGEEQADHCWVERDGWIYDTSWGLRFRKWIYYLMEAPKVRRRKDEVWCRQQVIYQELMEQAGNFHGDRFVLPILVPQMELMIENTVPRGWARYELELFKQTCNYDQIVAEMEAEMKEASMVEMEAFGIL